MSLLVILNVAGHTPSADMPAPTESPSVASFAAVSLNESKAQLVHKSAPEVVSDMNATHRPHRLLASKMTSHRLTNARLSIPPQTQAVTNIAEAQ